MSAGGGWKTRPNKSYGVRTGLRISGGSEPESPNAIANSRKPGERPPAPLVQQWADDLIAHVGSDPVHPGLRPALRSDQPIARRTYRLYTALKSRRCDIARCWCDRGGAIHAEA